MARHRLFPPYWALVVLAAFAWLFVSLPPALADPLPLTGLAVLLVLMVLSDLVPVRIAGGGFVTPGASLDFAALLLFGGPLTGMLIVAATAIGQGAIARRPAQRVVFNAALYVLGIAAADAVFRALGGRPGNLALPRDGLALAACAPAYFLVNGLGLSTVLALTGGGDFRRLFHANFVAAAGWHLGQLAIGALAAFAFLSLGPIALPLVGLPLLLAALSYRRTFEMKEDLLEFVRALAEVLEEVDPYTRQHSLRVAEYSKVIARALGMGEKAVQDLEYGALLHDLGKVGRQYQYILQKPGRLSLEEQATMRAHPHEGAEIVAKVRALRGAAEIVRNHHERPDGLGYPAGLSGEDIPLGSRIVMVADAYDAMTSDRPYRRAMEPARAVAELAKHRGTQFDGAVVDALDRLVAAGRFPQLAPRLEEAALDLPPVKQGSA